MCEVVLGVKGVIRRRKFCSCLFSFILGRSNLKFVGMLIIFIVFISSFNFMVVDCK